MADRFDSEALSAAQQDDRIGVRAGDNHRFTYIWAVVVDGRVFIRSWGLSGRGWYEAFAGDPTGAAQIGGRDFDIQAVPVQGPELLDAVDDAYRTKYDTPDSSQYVEDINSPRSRATTTELVPVSESHT